MATRTKTRNKVDKASSLKKTSPKASSGPRKKSSATGQSKKKTSTTRAKSAKAGSAKKKASTATKKVTKRTTAAGKKTTTSSKKRTTAKGKSTNKDGEQVIKDFKKLINLTPTRLEEWLDTKESKKVGFKDLGKGESVGRESGGRIIKLLAKRKDRYTDEDVKHIHKVVGYIKRHLAQRPRGDITASNWRYSLMNWGHDPAK